MTTTKGRKVLFIFWFLFMEQQSLMQLVWPQRFVWLDELEVQQ